MKFFRYFFAFFFLVSTINASQSFSDVPLSHTNFEAIEQLKLSGIIQGYSDGTFKPEKTVNRAEALKIVLLGSKVTAEETEETGGFPDVEKGSWYASFVVKGKKLGIIKGNANGTFAPAREVNLAEMLKILLVTNAVKLDTIVDEDPYLDVKKTEWYAPYFAYALEKQLLDQASYEAVQPAHALTRGEMAELMYRLQNAVKDTQSGISFASYYSDALQGKNTASGQAYDKDKFTASHREFAFGTRVEVTNTLNGKSVIVTVNDRGPYTEGRVFDLSRAAFESISPLSKGLIPVTYRVLTVDDVDIEALPQDSLCAWKTSESNIATNYFVNAAENIDIQLYSELPTVFFADEVVDVSGHVNNDDVTEIHVLLRDEDGNDTIFTTPVKSGDFLAQIEMGDAGEKQISFFYGNKAVNYLASIEVFQPLCEKELSSSVLDAPQNPKFYVEDNETILRWDIGSANISRVVISQGENKEIRYFSGGKKGWKVFYPSFLKFSRGDFTVRVDTAQSESGKLIDRTTLWKTGKSVSFSAVEHEFAKKDESLVEIDNVQNTYFSGGDISFEGRLKSKVRSDFAVITPSGNVETKAILSDTTETNEQEVSVIPAGHTFKIVYQPEESGTYIVELTQESGSAIINVPVYKAGDVPLIPDYKDLQSVLKTDAELTVNAGAFAVEMLNLVNQERRSAQIDLVELDEAMTILAQARADTIAASGKLSHWDTEGKTVDDIRILYGVKTAVMENLAEEVSVQSSHEATLRSALYRKNILDEHWERAGFGFAKSSDGKLIAVELFSTYPIKSENLPKMREEVLELLNSKRETLFEPSATLASLAQNWSEQMVEQDFFDFTDTQSQTLSDSIRKGGVLQTVGTAVFAHTSWLEIRNLILADEKIVQSRWGKLGVGISEDAQGIIKVTVLYSE